MSDKLWSSTLDSEYSVLWKRYLQENQRRGENPIKWYTKYKKEMGIYSRDQIRILIGIRSGHLKLNYYLHTRLKRITSSWCKFCSQKEDLEHLMRDCREPERVEKRNELVALSTELHAEQHQEDSANQSKPRWILNSIDHQDPYTYLFKCRLQNGRKPKVIQKLINLVRFSMKNNHWSIQ